MARKSLISRLRSLRKMSENSHKNYKTLWTKVQDVNETYYTPSKKKKTVYKGFSSSEEAAEYLNTTENSECRLEGLVSVEIEEASGNLTEVPGGIYEHIPKNYDNPDKLVPFELRTDFYVEDNKIVSKIKSDLSYFLENEDVYKTAGAMYKTGFLLYGPPGNGKTSLIRHVLKNLLPEDAIVIFLNATPKSGFIEHLKNSLSSRLLVFVFEELAAEANAGKLEKLLQFLDGELSVNRSITFATTNYPEKLPGNLVERTNRFDRYYKVGNPDDEERKALISHFLGQEPSESDVKITKGLSSADIKEACLNVKIKNNSLQDFINMLKAHKDFVKKDFAEVRPIGLHRNYEDMLDD